MVSGLEALREICYGKQTDDPETTVAPSKGIVQRYVTRLSFLFLSLLKVLFHAGISGTRFWWSLAA